MQSPNAKTPVSKCLDLAAYTSRMCSKFPGNATLSSVAVKLGGVAGALADAQLKYADAVRAILPTRVDVKYANFVSDRGVRQTQQKAELADQKKNGPIATQAFPEGSAVITRLLGQSQVDAMIALEGRLGALAQVWPGALAEQQAIAQLRQDYKGAIDSRTKAIQDAAALRAVRDVAKDQFLNVYAEAQGLVTAEFPRDTVMQDLFFDDVRSSSTAAQADNPEADPGKEAEPGKAEAGTAPGAATEATEAKKKDG